MGFASGARYEYCSFRLDPRVPRPRTATIMSTPAFGGLRRGFLTPAPRSSPSIPSGLSSQRALPLSSACYYCGLLSPVGAPLCPGCGRVPADALAGRASQSFLSEPPGPGLIARDGAPAAPTGDGADEGMMRLDTDGAHSRNPSASVEPTPIARDVATAAVVPHFQGGYEGSGGAGGGTDEVHPGDWTCPGCGMNVFASQDTCFRCGARKGDRGSGRRGLSCVHLAPTGPVFDSSLPCIRSRPGVSVVDERISLLQAHLAHLRALQDQRDGTGSYVAFQGCGYRLQGEPTPPR